MSAQPGTTYGTRFVFEATGQAIYSGTSVGDLYFRQDGTIGSPPEVIYVKATGIQTDTGWQVLL